MAGVAAETMAYEPGKASGLIPTGRGMVINMYRPSDVKPWRETRRSGTSSRST